MCLEPDSTLLIANLLILSFFALPASYTQLKTRNMYAYIVCDLFPFLFCLSSGRVPASRTCTTQTSLSEINLLADKFDLGPRLKQGGEGENWMKTQMVLFGSNTKKFIYSKVAYIFPYAGVTIFSKNLDAK